MYYYYQEMDQSTNLSRNTQWSKDFDTKWRLWNLTEFAWVKDNVAASSPSEPGNWKALVGPFEARLGSSEASKALRVYTTGV